MQITKKELETIVDCICEMPDEKKVPFIKKLVSSINNRELALSVFDDRCKYCGDKTEGATCFCTNDD